MGAFTGFVQGRAPLKVAFVGRRTRKIPLSQGFSSFKTVHRTVFGNSAKPTFPFTFFGAPSDWGVSRSAERDDWGFSPPSATAGNLASPTFHASLQPHFFDRRLSFVRERNKQGSWRSQLLGNSAKPTFHAPCNRIFLTSDSHLFGNETNREVGAANF